MTPNQKHLEILSEVTGLSIDEIKDELSRPENVTPYTVLQVHDAISCMQILQQEIDLLKAKYDTLHGLITFCSCDQPDFYHNDNVTCKRCNKLFDPQLT